MLILVVTSILPPHPGGAASCFSLILDAMGERYKDGDSKIVCLTERGAKKEYPASVTVDDTFFQYDSLPLSDRKPFLQLINYLKLTLHLIFNRYDVVHIHARYVYGKLMGGIIWHVLNIFQKRVVIDIRDRFYRGRADKHNYLLCSKGLVNHYKNIPISTMIPIPLSTEKNENVVPQHKVAYFGSIVENKGIFSLLEAYDNYSVTSEKPLKLELWGNNVIGDKFLDAINTKDGIEWMGVLPVEKVQSKMLEYKAIILPSKSEGFPRVCLEGMFANRIVVLHESIIDLTEFIPPEFVFKDDAVGGIEEALLSIENHSGIVSYDYDFSIHFPKNVVKKIVENIYENCKTNDRN